MIHLELVPVVRFEPHLVTAETNSVEQNLADLVKKMQEHTRPSKTQLFITLYGFDFEFCYTTSNGKLAWEAMIEPEEDKHVLMNLDFPNPIEAKHVYPLFYTKSFINFKEGAYFAMILPFNNPNVVVANYLRRENGFQPNQIVVFHLSSKAANAIPFGRLDLNNETAKRLLQQVSDERNA